VFPHDAVMPILAASGERLHADGVHPPFGRVPLVGKKSNVLCQIALDRNAGEERD
jgi:hypothetical protein